MKPCVRSPLLPLVALSAALTGLTACSDLLPDFANGDDRGGGVPLTGSEKPGPRPPVTTSAQSEALAAHYVDVESSLIRRGLLRTDSGADIAISAEDLADIFVRVATYDEYSPEAGRIIAQAAPSHLRRWQDPVRMEIEFGRSVPQDQRDRDRRTVRDLANRMARVTGHSVAMGQPANFLIFVMDEDERRARLHSLHHQIPGLTPDVLYTLRTLSRSEFCAVVGVFDDSTPYILHHALVFVRAEHPPLLRLSCFHEEIAQGMGLPNDTPLARPSIFNDDEEFALITDLDELLLKMLYDPRLRPGMTPDEVAPIALQIARDLIQTLPRLTKES